MNIFEKLKSNHIIINFIDEDGNNTLMLIKDAQSAYAYTDYNNVDSLVFMDIEIQEDVISLNTMLSGDRNVKMQIKYENNIQLHIYKETNSKVIVNDFVIKDEISSKKMKAITFSGEFI